MQSWFGALPKDWRIIPARALLAERKDRSKSGEETLLSVSEYYGVLPKADVVEAGDFLSRSESFEEYRICSPGDLAVNIMLAWKRGLGVSNYEGVISPSYAVFRFRKGAHPRYYHYLLRTDLYCAIFGAYSTGVIPSRWRLYPEVLLALPLVCPPIAEQVRISEFLDLETAKADALVAKYVRLLELLEEKRFAIITQAVTKGLDPRVTLTDVSLGSSQLVPSHWRIMPAKRLLQFVTSGSRGWADYNADSGDLFLRITNLTRDSIDLDLSEPQYVQPPGGAEGVRTRVMNGDILVSITADLGSVAHIADLPAPAYVSQHVALCRPNVSVDSRWLAYALKAKPSKSQFEQAAYGGTKVQLSLEDVRSIVVPVPPKSEQVAIANKLDADLSSLQGLVSKITRGVILAKERRSTLIASAVTGQISVRAYAPENVEVVA